MILMQSFVIPLDYLMNIHSSCRGAVFYVYIGMFIQLIIQLDAFVLFCGL